MINIDTLPYPINDVVVTKDDLHITSGSLGELDHYYVHLDIQVGNETYRCHWSNDHRNTHYLSHKLMWNSDDCARPEHQNNTAINKIFMKYLEEYDDWQSLADA